MKHHITKYREEGSLYVESWLQLNLLGKAFCFSRRKLLIEGAG